MECEGMSRRASAIGCRENPEGFGLAEKLQ